MTARMHEAVLPLLGPDVTLTALTAPYGAPSIEGYYDEAFVVLIKSRKQKTLAIHRKGGG